MKKTKRLLALLLALVMVFALAACGNSDTDDGGANVSNSGGNGAGGSGEEKILTAAVTAAWDTLAPHATTFDIGGFIVFMMYEPLLSMDMEDNIIPRLAESWEWSSDGKTVTFHLNENANWTDGTPITANDFVFTCRMLSKKDYNSRSSYLTYIAGTDDSGYELSEDSVSVVAEDEKTVVVNLKAAVDESMLFGNIKRIWVIPEHIYGDMPVAEIATASEWSNNPVTSGAMKLDAQISGEQIEMVANDDFYLGRPNIDRFIVKVMTSSAMAAALTTGDIDFTPGANVSSLSFSDYDTLVSANSINVEAVKTYAFQYLAVSWNTYSDVRVRQALSLAINRQAIIDNVLLGNGEPLLTQYVSISDYYLPELYEGENPGYDPDRAIQLLNDAGWDFNEEITIYYHSGNEMREQTCLMLQQFWKAIGLNVTLQAQDTSSMMSGLSSGDFPIGTMGQSGDSTAYNFVDLYTQGHPVVDMSHLTTSYFYDTMIAMKFMTNLDKIIADCVELQNEMIEQVPYIYLYSPYTLQAASTRLQNYTFADANAYYWPIWQWDLA